MTSADERRYLIKESDIQVITSRRLVTLGHIGQLGLILLVPMLLITISTRVVMFPWFLKFEYNRPGFPQDVYGFSLEERLHYAPQVLDYLFNDKSIDFLAAMTFDDGSPLFNDSELRHLVDVQGVTEGVFALMYASILMFFALMFAFFRKKELRDFVLRGIINGCLITIGIIISVVVVVVMTWDTFFTAFHSVFFESGTWRFAYSDTLIRLFPERFWMDAAFVVGGMTMLGACILLSVARSWRRHR